MGVRGLTTYINYNQDCFLENFFLHDCYLVIDGYSLCSQLYRRLNCFSAFGGDYDKFALYVRNFFKKLRRCNVTSLVLFDGIYEHRKLKTAYSRLRSKINGASRLDPVTQGTLQIFPLLLRDVFTEALNDMNVANTICEFEADDEIAAMARHINCPVLSYDSDFFIYNVLYIPFNTLESKPIQLDESGNKLYAMECKIYRVERMTSHFGLKEELLPLLATLLGNDYVEKKVFKKFFMQLKLPKSKISKNEQQRCIYGLFKWLQNETLDTATEKILGRMKKEYKPKTLSTIKKSVSGYNSNHCESIKYLNIDSSLFSKSVQFTDNYQIAIYNEEIVNKAEYSDEKDHVHESEDSVNELTDSENESQENDSSSDDDDEDTLIHGLPIWIAQKIRNNHIPKSYINLYTHHLYFCSPQAEDYSDSDCFLCTLPILRYAFDILTDFSQEYCIYVSREKDNNYKREYIGNEYSTTRPLEVSFRCLMNDELKLYFYHFIQEKMDLLDLTVIEMLPSNFQVFMISVLWWVKTCVVPLTHVHSLFMCYVMLEAIDEKIGSFRGHYYFNTKYSKKLEEIKTQPVCKDEDENLFLNKNKIQYEDSLLAASTLLKHFELDEKIQKRPKSYDVKKMHSFAQFQCCLLQFNSLNTLCCCPFENTKYCKSYNGTFVYNIAVKLQNQIDPCGFFKQYLKGAETVLKFYQSLCEVFQKCADSMNLQMANKNIGKKKRRKRNSIEDEINFIVKGFESEVFI